MTWGRPKGFNGMIYVNSISASYDGVTVLQDLTLNIDVGEHLGLVAPNGSGKTTLIKIISGIKLPDSGSVNIGGHQIASLRPKHRARLVSVVQQNPTIPVGLTAKEVVLMGRNPYLSLVQWEGRSDLGYCEEAMVLTQTSDLADRPIKSLSGGELKRVFIARALVQDTPVMLLDEPTAHLDIFYQIQILDLIEDIRTRTNMTIICAMHDLNMAAQYSNRIAVLHQKQIYALGQPNEILTGELILKVFGARVAILKHPTFNVPVILPTK